MRLWCVTHYPELNGFPSIGVLCSKRRCDVARIAIETGEDGAEDATADGADWR